jgi:esterase
LSGSVTNDLTKATDRRIELDGGSFRYREAGASTAAPVVLLHQLGRDAHDWDTVSAALADRFRVLALDLRGHGESPRAPPFTFEQMRDDVVRFADALRLERFSLVGHSMGGTVARGRCSSAAVPRARFRKIG